MYQGAALWKPLQYTYRTFRAYQESVNHAPAIVWKNKPSCIHFYFMGRKQRVRIKVWAVSFNGA
jgi:hypothetical protein